MGIEKSRINQFIADRGNFTMIPNEIWELEGIDWIAKVIWCYLYSRSLKWDSSRNNVAKNLGMCVKTVSAYVKQLEELGMLKVEVGARGSWHFEIIPPSEWSNPPEAITSSEEVVEIPLKAKASTTEGTAPPVLEVPDLHTQEVKIFKKILKPKSGRKKSEQPLVKKKDEPVPDELMDYHLVLKTVGLHLKFKELLPQIKEVWPDYDNFKEFLSERKAFFEKADDIKKNYHKFRAVLTKAIKGELGV